MIDKLINQQKTIKGMQENEESAIKIMKMYEDYKLRVDKAIEYIEKEKRKFKKNTYVEMHINAYNKKQDDLLDILKGEDKE